MAQRPKKRALPPPKPNALKKRIGRPPVPLDTQTAARLAGIGATVEEIAAGLGCSTRHVYDRISQDPEFAEAIEQGRAFGRATLRRMQWKLANAGNPAMQIWLGKQMLGQRDYASIDEISASLSASQSGADKVFKFTLKIGDRKPADEDESGPLIEG